MEYVLESNYGLQNTAVSVTNNTIEQEELIYDDKWMGKYSQKDIDYLNNLVQSLTHCF